MANMSYCRFENTARDLDDCQEALEGLVSGDQAPLSVAELRAAKNLASTCFNILQLLADEAGVTLAELADTSDPEAVLARAVQKVAQAQVE